MRVAIVGGGFSGAVTAVQLARRLVGDAAIDIIEPRPLLGGGVAYSAADAAHRINVPAARMTVFGDDPGHFDRWMRAQGALVADPAARWTESAAFPQRGVFGRYVAHLVDTAKRERPGLMIRHRQASVRDIHAHPAGFTLGLASGVVLEADIVVLAVSHPPPAVPAPLRQVLADGAAVIVDPWSAGALDAVSPDADVLVVGTGLTMADVVASLDRRGHRGRILAVSRRGLLSRGHVFGDAEKRDQFAVVFPPRSARGLCGLVRAQVRLAATEGAPWQAVFDDIRTNAGRLWSALPEAEQRRVVRHLRPFWDVHRFRVSPQAETAIARLRDAGQFTSMAASLAGANWDGTELAVRLRPRRTAADQAITWVGDAVVVTTGPAHGGALISNPALASLSQQGLVRADRVGLGLDVDWDSHAIGADGHVRETLLVVGPLARGRFGELMGLPQVSEHAEAVATEVARLIAKMHAAARPRASASEPMVLRPA